MTSNVPWKELAMVGATTLGVCCIIGWLTNAENLQKKKKQPRGAPGGHQHPHDEPVENQEVEAMFMLGESALKKENFPQAEKAFLRILELAEDNTDPRLATLTLYIRKRLADIYERMEQWDKSLFFFEKVLEELKAKDDLSPDEAHLYMTLCERAADIITAQPGFDDRKEPILHTLLDAATKNQHMQNATLALCMLGRTKLAQDKLVEAEAYFRRAGTAYTDPSTREELWLQIKTSHFDALTRLENHEQAKKVMREVADFLLNANLSTSAKGLESTLLHLGERAAFLGYHDEAEYILKGVLSIMKKRGTAVVEMAGVDHSLAVILCATNRRAQALEKIKEMKEYLRTGMGSSIFPMYSRYLQTQGMKHDAEGTVVTVYRGKEPARILKPGSILVVKFENPDQEGEFLPDVEHVVEATDQSIQIKAPVDYSNYIGQIFFAEIQVLSAEREQLGTHFVFIPSTTPVTASASLPPKVDAAFIQNLLANALQAEANGEELQGQDALALAALLNSMQGGDEGRVFMGEEGEDDDDEDEFESGEVEDDEGEGEGEGGIVGKIGIEEDDEEKLVFNR